jgi:hypothetical protein
MKRVTVEPFKGKVLVHIREYYVDKDGQVKPGRKGIALNKQQWEKFYSYVKEINDEVQSL